MLANIGVERALLASICKHGGDALIEIEDVGVRIESFTDTSNQAIYSCLQKILHNNDEIDQALLLIALNENGYASLFNHKKDIEYLGSLFNFPIKKENIRSLAQKLEKVSIARKAINKHQEAIENLNQITGVESIDKIVQISEDPIFDLVIELNRNKNDGPQLLFENVEEILEYLKSKDGECIGIPTPWQQYNQAIGGGLRRGGVNLIGARPKVGKTTLAKENLIYCSESLNIPCLFLDTEMVANDHVIRALSSNSKIPLDMVETGQFKHDENHLQNITEIAKKLKSNDKLYHESISGKHFDEVLAIIRRWIVKHVGFDENGNTNDCVVIYDYFKLMDKTHLENLKEYEALGYQISKLTDFCKEYDFPCLAFVQLNRQHEVSQCDRLIWLCNSFSKFELKDPNELVDDGPGGCNRKLTVYETRYGPGIEDGDYICVNFERSINRIEEIDLRSKLGNRNNDDFERTEDNEPAPF